MNTEAIVECLRNLGFEDEKCSQAGKFYETGQKEELLRTLKMCRCTLMDEMHESQRKVDRIDYMIRKAEKETV